MTHGEKKFDKKYYTRFFSKYSNSELDIYYRWSLGWFNFLKKFADIGSGLGREVLEIGSSIGAFSKVLKERGFKVDATDISPYIISKAKKLQKGINFFVFNVEKPQKLKKKYNFVFSFEVLEHLKNPEKALINIKEMLKKDGILIFSTPFPTKRSLSDPTHINVHEEKWWLELGKKTGYNKRKVIYATFIPYLYRISSVFSWGFPLKTDIPFANSTAFYIFTK